MSRGIGHGEILYFDDNGEIRRCIR